MNKFKVYVLPDDAGNVIAVNSHIFQQNLTGWVQIDEGKEIRYLHAQGNYFPKPIRTELGVYRYRLVDGAVQELSDSEIAALEAQIQVPGTNQEERIRELEEALELILSGVTE